MPTQKECNDYQKELYRHISCRVKRWVFVMVVGAFAALVVLGGMALWNTAERAQATELRQVADKEARVTSELVRDKEYKALTGAIDKMDGKLDKVIEKIHEERW